MPYFIERVRNGYFVVNAGTGKRYSKEPVSHVTAVAQRKALYANSKEFKGGSFAEEVATLQALLPIPMSDSQIHAVLGRDTRVIPYRETANYRSIDDLLGPAGQVILLYELKDKRGHWVAVFKHGRRVSVFDPLGIPIEKEKRYINPLYLAQSGQDEHYLGKLLLACPYTIEWNNHKLQRNAPGVNTCGKHCCVRLCYKDMDADAYAAMLKSGELTPDEVVCYALA